MRCSHKLGFLYPQIIVHAKLGYDSVVFPLIRISISTNYSTYKLGYGMAVFPLIRVSISRKL